MCIVVFFHFCLFASRGRGISLLTILFCINLANSYRKHEQGWVPLSVAIILLMMIIIIIYRLYTKYHIAYEYADNNRCPCEINDGNLHEVKCVILHCIFLFIGVSDEQVQVVNIF